jgi:hypothetical protein
VERAALPEIVARKKPTPEYTRARDYRRRYGITVEQYEAKLAEQGGVCSLCKRPPKKIRLAVDHDHITGAVRELLCPSCNRAISHLEDPYWYAAARDYLDRHHPERELD